MFQIPECDARYLTFDALLVPFDSHHAVIAVNTTASPLTFHANFFLPPSLLPSQDPPSDQIPGNCCTWPASNPRSSLTSDLLPSYRPIEESGLNFAVRSPQIPSALPYASGQLLGKTTRWKLLGKVCDELEG
jgi:hypothetical protein